MSKRCQIFHISLAIILSMTFSSCGRKDISLPNKYNLSINSNEKAFIIDSSNSQVFDDPVAGFVVNSECIYGWLDNPAENLFFLDMKSTTKAVFNTPSELDHYLNKRNLPKLTMKDSLTFLDIATGHKKKSW